MLTEDQINLLEIMKGDSSTSEEFFRPSPVLWEYLSSRFEENLIEQGIDEIQSSAVNTFFSLLDLDIFTRHYFKCSMWLLYNDIKRRDINSILDKTEALIPLGMNPDLFYNPESITNRPKILVNKKLTWDYLITLDTILNISLHCPWILTDPCVVVDLGAGWGRIGYILTQLNKKISYNILDIPHSLLVSQEYIKKNIPRDVKIYEYLENRGIEKFSKDFLLDSPGIRFMGTQDLKKFEDKSIDVFINIASFQEMSLDQVSSYFNLIDQKSNYFYTQQRYQDLDMNYDIYPYKKEWKKIFDRDVSFLPLWFESLFNI